MSMLIDETIRQKYPSSIVQLIVKRGYKMEKELFINRLVQLRMNKGVSARDMSLSLGQSAGYINNIENGVNYPSMSVFFYICEYLGVTPQEFFDINNTNPLQSQELLEAIKGLNNEQLSHITAIAKDLSRKKTI